MISENTPPGTEVVCIDAAPGEYGPVDLVVGDIYTVKEIAAGIRSSVVFVQEVKPMMCWHPAFGQVKVGFDLSRFRYLQIPRSLTELLTETRVPEDA